MRRVLLIGGTMLLAAGFAGGFVIADRVADRTRAEARAETVSQPAAAPVTSTASAAAVAPDVPANGVFRLEAHEDLIVAERVSVLVVDALDDAVEVRRDDATEAPHRHDVAQSRRDPLRRLNELIDGFFEATPPCQDL